MIILKLLHNVTVPLNVIFQMQNILSPSHSCLEVATSLRASYTGIAMHSARLGCKWEPCTSWAAWGSGIKAWWGCGGQVQQD